MDAPNGTDDDGGTVAGGEGRDDGLSPVQRETLERLAARAQDRPVFPVGLRDDLRAALDMEIGDAVGSLPADLTLYVNKHALASVHACEAQWHSDRLSDEFVPSAATVRGSVAHKAIELTLNRRVPATPAELVDRALDRMADTDHWAAEWLRTCDEDDRAEVRGEAVARVSAFTEIWPALKPAWRPITEQPLRAEVAGGRVHLAGKVDLTLGRSEGMRAGKVIVDFKTGQFVTDHLDDLRFYALVEALRTGVPPRALATSYLDSGQLHVEQVTEGLLHAASARTADGVRRMIAILFDGEVPGRRPSGRCRWCRERSQCEPGLAFLDAHGRSEN